MRADEYAAALIERHGGVIPVPIEQIFDTEGIAVGRNHDDSLISGFAYRDGRHRIIGLNTQTSPRRQRFALAHAFGHLLMHDRPLTVCHSIRLDMADFPARPTPAMEGEADRFAGALLMPREPLVAALQVEIDAGHDSRDALIGALARRFEVSVEATGWRLVSLNLTMA